MKNASKPLSYAPINVSMYTIYDVLCDERSSPPTLSITHISIVMWHDERKGEEKN
jgi:hypothetical protein